MRNVAVSLKTDNQIEIRVGTESRAGESYYPDDSAALIGIRKPSKAGSIPVGSSAFNES